MKALLFKDGVLQVIAEDQCEAYALQNWLNAYKKKLRTGTADKEGTLSIIDPFGRSTQSTK